MSFSIDFNRLLNQNERKASSLPFWLSYGLSFINGFEYRSPGEGFAVALNRTDPLIGDALGLFPGVVHEWDGVDEKLSLDSLLKSDRISLRFFAEDLSFSDYDETDPRIILGSGVSFTPFAAWPFSFSFSLISDYAYKMPENTRIFPSVHADIPILSASSFLLSLRLGYIQAITDYENWKNNLYDNAYYIGLPFSFENTMISFGAMIQGKSIRYNMFNPQFSMQSISRPIALFIDSDVSTRYFDLALNVFVNYDRQENLILWKDSYFDISLGFKLGNIDFLVGARRQGEMTTGFFESSDYFLGIETQTGSLKSKLQFRVLDGKPQLGFTSSFALIDLENLDMEKKGERFFDLKFDLGFDKLMGKRAYFILTPILFLGNDDHNIAFRFPFYLQADDSRFAMISVKADEWWDVFKPVLNVHDFFDSITDVFQLIEQIGLGSEKSFVHLEANRHSTRNDIFFDNYKSFDALSLEAELNFHNMKIGAYIDDLEAPRIMDISLGIYPFDSDGGGLLINAPTEIKAKSRNDYEITTFIGASLFMPFLNNKLDLSFYVYSEMSARYINGIPEDIRIVYDFENNRFFGYLIGAAVNWTDSHLSAGLSGGINSGKLNPNTYNAFTSLNPDKEKPNTDVEGISAYIVADFRLDFDFISLIAKYTMPNIVSIFKDFNNYSGDMFTIKFNYMIPNGVGISFQISRTDFISTLDTIFEYENYFNSPSTIYAVSLLKEFDNMALEATFGTGAIYEKGEYINSYNLVEVAPMLKIKTRIGF